jgi:hypothetical protein
MENELLNDRIGAYLNNKLSELEKNEFEKELNQNLDLQTEVEKLRLLKSIAQKHQTRAMIQEIQAQKLEEWSNDQLAINPSRGRSVSLWKNISVALAACLVMAVGYLSFSPIATPQPDMEMVTERGKDTQLSKTDQFYYEQFYKGQDLLKHNKPTEALACFEKVQAAEGIRQYYKDASTWYSAVAYLNNHQPEKAKTLMQEIDENPDFTFEIETLDKLKMDWKLMF